MLLRSETFHAIQLLCEGEKNSKRKVIKFNFEVI